jgi:hypothetical protein
MMHDEYYEKGFFKTEIDDITKKLLWNEVYNTNWINDSGENIYKEIPDWYRSNKKYHVSPDGSDRSMFERNIGRDTLKNTPKSLVEIGLDLIQSNSFQFFKTYYQNAELQYIDLWNGSEEIPYHFDTVNGSDTLVLIYLTEQHNWNHEWGGSIALKKQYLGQTIFEEEFNPYDGMMLVVNNANPLVLHKVRALKNLSVNRYTFSFIYKWF